VLDSHFLRALFAAAKQERSPFIINIAEVHFKYVSLDSLVEAVKFEAARHDIPVVLNLDHGLHFDAVVRALRLGFSSVMFDGSTLSYEKYSPDAGSGEDVPCGGRLRGGGAGRGRGDEGGALYGHADEAFFTDPQLAREFVDSTGIDALASPSATHTANTKASRNSISRVWTPFASRPACRWFYTAAPALAMPTSAAPSSWAFIKSISIPACRRPRSRRGAAHGEPPAAVRRVCRAAAGH
jgi:hypothetical protein